MMTSPRSIQPPENGSLDLFSLSPEELRQKLTDMGMARYRADQILAWIYRRFVANFDEMTDLSRQDRQLMTERFRVELPRVQDVKRTGDGMTAKLLLQLRDGCAVEGVVMLHPKRRPTLCVSTQVGCAQGCLFCATGTMGLVRDMEASEILSQIWLLRRHLARDLGEERVPTLVFMGMGEPLDNEANLHKAIGVLNDASGFGLGSRKMTLSTVGSAAGIRRLADLNLQIQLAVSLHAATDALRRKMIPGQRTSRIEELIDAARDYHERTGREITFEYVLIDRVNDSEEEARRLATLMKGIRGKVNLIPLNPVDHNNMQPPAPLSLSRFRNALEQGGIKVTVRHSQGREISAACGQLAVNSSRPQDSAAGAFAGPSPRRCA